MKKSPSIHPLLTAVKAGQRAEVTDCLERGCDPNEVIDTNRDTLLHIAVQNGFTPILEQLLGFGALVESKNFYGDTPLHLAARENRVECVVLLLQYDTGSTTCVDKAGNGQRVALHYAARHVDGEVARCLLETTSDVNAQDKNGRTALHEATINDNRVVARQLLMKGAQPMLQDRAGFAALHLAMEKRNLAMAILLMEYGAPFEQKNSDGKTALEVANMSAPVLMRLAIEQQLYSEPFFHTLVNRAHLDLDGRFEGNMGLLHIAAMHRQHQTVVWLLSQGVPIGQTNASDYTALHIAAKMGDLATVRLLVDHGIQIHHRDKLGDTALNKALKQLARPVEGEEAEVHRQRIEEVIHYLTQKITASEHDNDASSAAAPSATRRADAFRLNPVILTPRMQARKLIGGKYYQMTKINRKEAREIAEKTGLEIPFTLGENERVFILGRGNFGFIKVACQRETGAFVVSKKVKGERDITQSKAEAYLQKEAAGPNVLPIYNTIELSDLLYHFMPLAGLGNGRAVQALLANATRDLRTHGLTLVAKDLLTGLMTCHKKGIYHLDIKPENIVFTKDGRCYITDFGCAKRADNLDPRVSWKCIGDNYYFPPERYRAVREQGQYRADRADVWAAGLTLLELFSNQAIADLLKLPTEMRARFHECTVDFFRERLQAVSILARTETESIYDVIRGLLEPVQDKRLTIADALEAHCFRGLDPSENSSVFGEMLTRPMAHTERVKAISDEEAALRYSKTPVFKQTDAASDDNSNDQASYIAPESDSDVPRSSGADALPLSSAFGHTSSPASAWTEVLPSPPPIPISPKGGYGFPPAHFLKNRGGLPAPQRMQARTNANRGTLGHVPPAPLRSTQTVVSPVPNRRPLPRPPLRGGLRPPMVQRSEGHRSWDPSVGTAGPLSSQREPATSVQTRARTSILDHSTLTPPAAASTGRFFAGHHRHSAEILESSSIARQPTDAIQDAERFDENLSPDNKQHRL